jgi:hypothetical protein
VRASDGRLSGPGLVVESAGAQEGPLERVAAHEVLVCLVFPLHVGGDVPADARRERDVFVGLWVCTGRR